jgi:DNA polymerase-3 subunit alpha
MGEALKETYGTIIFQENIMKIAQVLAGFTGGQADTLRKVVGKKKPELIKKEKLDVLFIQGCVENGIDDKIAKEIFKQIYQFAGYGFNKSHSAAYSLLAYQTAYLKKHYPIEFMCNLLTSEMVNNDKNIKFNTYINQARQMGFKAFRPDINLSKNVFVIEERKGEEILRAPFTTLKGVGTKAVEEIVAKQPYPTFEDFMRKTESTIVNKTVFEALLDVGCMDESWPESREELKRLHPIIKKKIDKQKKLKEKREEKLSEFGGASLFDEFDYSGKDINF